MTPRTYFAFWIAAGLVYLLLNGVVTALAVYVALRWCRS